MSTPTACPSAVDHYGSTVACARTGGHQGRRHRGPTGHGYAISWTDVADGLVTDGDGRPPGSVTEKEAFLRVSPSHMLRHRKRRIRKKWGDREYRLAQLGRGTVRA